MVKKNYKTITILPYLHLDAEIKFDDLRIWPFHKYKDSFLKDANLRNHIEKILRTYTRAGGHRIDKPSILTNSKYQFPNIYKKTIDKIEYTKQALLIPAMLKMNSWSFVTSENFSSYFQRFQVGNTGISTQAGAIHGISAGGYTMDEIQFQKPEYVHLANQPVKFDIPTLVAMLDMYAENSTNSVKTNIINSLNPFFYSYKNTNEIPTNTRVLNLIMSFELLFGQTGRANFRNNILNYTSINPSSEAKHPYPIINTRIGNTMNTVDLTLSQIWAEEFYKLRHKVIHGDVVSSDDFVFEDIRGYASKNNPHFYIAINMFIVCLLKKLRDLAWI